MAGPFRLLGALLVVGCAPLSAQGRSGARPPLAITHVTVIDGTGAAPLPDRTVVVAGGRITDIAPSARAHVPASATIVDGRGRFLIPGLWDMHVHQNMGLPGADTANTPDTNRAASDAMLLSNGVTGVRDMGGLLANSVRWRDAVRRGELVAPRMFVTGTKLGDRPVVPGAPFPIRTADDVHRSVTLLREGGADFVKIGSGLPAELVPVAVADARQAGLKAVGHAPNAVNAREASEAGMASLEHLLGVLIACDTNEATVRRLAKERQAPVSIWERIKRRFGTPVQRPSELPALISGYSEPRCEQLADLFVRNHTWQTPTLRMWRRVDKPVENRQVFALYQRIVALMSRRGVRIMAGTDTPTNQAVPGEALHEELAELVEAGLTPMQALQAATRNPAEFLGVLDSVGTIERTKLADLVLLDADPLHDIHNARRVNAVVVAGRLLRGADLDTMRARAGLAAPGGIALMLALFFAVYGAVFVAEIVGDKLLYTTGILATRYRSLPIMCGMALAFMAKMAVAVAIGQAIAQLPPLLVAAITTTSFLGVAYTLWRKPDVRPGARESHDASTAALVSFAAIFFSEWGDVGQITAATMAARFPVPVVVWLGAVAAMVTKGILAAFLGAGARQWIQDRLSPTTIRYGSVALLLVLGIFSVIETLMAHTR